ncbi:6-phosphofructokinase [Catenovulum agarivorans DS-2]|uniref:6-phosphofructokinase n=1 Tax=Catenovulum agarivorans DS-2 TaxID=1328313 RepID=W7QWZ9_9ALTE|nr:ATP-dependent 6-phosphofructokinase [Catenovulum agarivorans]EWH12258.1 6-phosphofructokinase [Catenovulum agarivorans DS-2]
MKKTIAVITSGGDAPGMNACIRAIVLTANRFGHQVIGFKHGYNGLIENEKVLLSPFDVQHTIQLGGTILKSARCLAFTTDKGLIAAVENLNKNEVDALVVIGGDGSLRGLDRLQKHWDGQVIGVPGTIDNDLNGTDNTIGYQTAIDTALDSIDKLRDTADAFERIFLVEVMGRHAGFIALASAVASGAEQALFPESIDDPHTELESIVQHVECLRQVKGKSSIIMVIAEHLWPGGVSDLAETLTNQIGIECRPCILGHIQRGGAPVAYDRILATKLGSYAVEIINEGQSGVMVGEINNRQCAHKLNYVYSEQKELDPYLVKIQQNLFDVVQCLNLSKK